MKIYDVIEKLTKIWHAYDNIEVFAENKEIIEIKTEGNIDTGRKAIIKLAKHSLKATSLPDRESTQGVDGREAP